MTNKKTAFSVIVKLSRNMVFKTGFRDINVLAVVKFFKEAEG